MKNGEVIEVCGEKVKLLINKSRSCDGCVFLEKPLSCAEAPMACIDQKGIYVKEGE